MYFTFGILVAFNSLVHILSTRVSLFFPKTAETHSDQAMKTDVSYFNLGFNFNPHPLYLQLSLTFTTQKSCIMTLVRSTHTMLMLTKFLSLL